MIERGDWREYERLVLSEIERLSEELMQTRKSMIELRTDLAVLSNTVQIKSGVWGALAGVIPAGLYLAWDKLTGK